MSEMVALAREALVSAGVTGPHQSHSRHNAISKIRAMLEGDPNDTFGISGLDKYSAEEVLGFVADLTGCSDDIALLDGYDVIDPDLTMKGIVAAAERLADEAGKGSLLLAATGHPTGMLEHYIRVADVYRRAGGKALRLREQENLSARRGKHVEVRYVGGVGCVADWGALLHTHSPDAMTRLLEAEPWPEIVLGDHGFAGAAIERGIPTVAFMDINDPALAVASAEGRDVVVVPVDDNRPPNAYEASWQIFETILSGGEL